MKRTVYCLAFLSLLWSVPPSSFATSYSAPGEPLTLSEALNITSSFHPSIESAELDVARAHTDYDFYQNGNRSSVEALIVPQRADRAVPGAGSSQDDSYATLRFVQPIYDFGRKQASEVHAETELKRTSDLLEHRIQQQQLTVMRRFFNVLVANLDYAVKNEKMTLAFLRFNRLQEESEMHEAHAEVDVLAHETIYREKFHERQQAGINQIATRRSLVLAMGFIPGHHDYVPRDLVPPDVADYVNREVPVYETMLEQVMANSYELTDARLKLQGAENALDVSIKKYSPTLDAILEATEWVQETGSRNSASIGIQIRVPLVAGATKKRDRQIARIEIEQARVKVEQLKYDLRARVFDLWKKLQLYQVELAAAKVRTEFRDQYMDRSRTLYELEEIADLGDAQAEQLRALLETKRIEYELTMAWAEFEVLRGAGFPQLGGN